MRFVWAVAAFFLAALLIGAGIAQRTVFLGPQTERSKVSGSGAQPYTLIDGAVLAQHPGAQTLTVRGDGSLFVAYGRTADVKAWLADADYTLIALKKGTTTSRDVPASVDPSTAPTTAPVVPGGGDADTLTATPAPTTAARAPGGSDLWLDEFHQRGSVVAPLTLPTGMSVLVASDGTKPAPSDVSISWSLDNTTPWAGPLILGGGLLLLTGIVLWVLGIRHVRRSRGPRRKPLPPLPETEPIDLAADGGEGAGKGVISATPPTRRRALSARRSFIVLPLAAASMLAFSGCSAGAWPQFGAAASASPSPSSSVIVPEGQQQPVVTLAQAERILARVGQTIGKADADRDGDLAATRLAGAALAERLTDYRLMAGIPGRKAMPAVAYKPLTIVLPQAVDGWPRTVMTIVTDRSNAKVAPSIAMLTQQDPWSPYRLTYVASLEAAAQLPKLAPAWIGAPLVAPDSPFLVMQPDKLAAAYADILTNGAKSSFAAAFDTSADQYAPSVAADRQKRLAAFNQTASATGSLTFSTSAGQQPPLALATLESGAIVAVNLYETDTVRPTNADAVIKLDNNPTVQLLAGTAQSQTGFVTTFSDQLFFYVPGQGSNEKIRLLGYASNILSAGVIQ